MGVSEDGAYGQSRAGSPKARIGEDDRMKRVLKFAALSLPLLSVAVVWAFAATPSTASATTSSKFRSPEMNPLSDTGREPAIRHQQIRTPR